MSKQPCNCNGHMADSEPRKVNFYSDHFIPNGWKLVYNTLNSDWRTLYLTGYCQACLGELTEEIPLSTASGDALLAELYEKVQSLHPHDQKSDLPDSAPFYYGRCEVRSAWYRHRDEQPLIVRNQYFLNLFHDYDRPSARRWLAAYTPATEHDEVLRVTGEELFCEVVRLAKECGAFEKADTILDYILPNENESSTSEHTELSCYEFDFVPIVNFGGSEGIYIDCYLNGKFDQSNRCSLRVGTLKTLRTDEDAAKSMGELCGALMYHASGFVNGNLHLFTPDSELLMEKQRKAKSREEDAHG